MAHGPLSRCTNTRSKARAAKGSTTTTSLVAAPSAMADAAAKCHGHCRRRFHPAAARAREARKNRAMRDSHRWDT